MFNFSVAPLTQAEFWQLVGAGIATVMLAAICMVGLWTLFGPEPYRENRRLSRIQRIVTWLGRHKGVTRIL